MSEIIAKNTAKIKLFWLYFSILGNGTEWIDYDLPIPTILTHTNTGYNIGYAIDGFFGTKQGIEFLNDVIARFLITFKDYDIQRLHYPPRTTDYSHIYKKIYKLRDFSRQLKSLPVKKKIPERADKFADFTFWAIKLYAEDMIRADGIIIYDSLESWALSNFEHKEKSTVRAKCRSVFNWYEERDFQIPKYKRYKNTKEETMATRSEHMRNVKKQEEQRNRAKVVNCLTGLMQNEYKKKSGSWHLRKICEATNLSPNTVKKYVREFEGKKVRKAKQNSMRANT